MYNTLLPGPCVELRLYNDYCSGLKGEVYEAVDNLNMSYFFSVCGVLDRQNDNVKDCEGGMLYNICIFQ